MNIDAFNNVAGLYTSVKDRKAYRYYTDETNNVLVKEVAIETVVCIDYKPAPEDPASSSVKRAERGLAAIPIFESKPGSQYVIYIDLDGEASTSKWNGGKTINAAARTWTDADVKIIWEIASEDFITWDVNVTTSRAIYDATPECKRKMCIVTSTSTAAPGSGGVAYVDSFDDCSGTPCWAFNPGAKAAGETISHEIGHTVGLIHDGRTSPSEAYYSGHNSWSPIMGTAYGAAYVGQWSMGEYASANNKENDLTIIGTHNGFGPRPDDIGNTTATAKMLVIETNGNVLDIQNRGLINNRTDIDIFKLTTASVGNLNLTIKPAAVHPDLNIKARLLNSSGTAIVTVDPTGTAFSTMSAIVTSNNLAAGTYYLEIDGVGNGADATVGYSDYASIGDYYISGTVPLPTNKPVPQFASSDSKPCAGTQVTYTDQTVGSTSWKWTFPGGTPSSSIAQNPTVTYNSSGTYDVKLVAQNANGKDSIQKASYVTVIATPASPVTTGASRCGAGVVNLSSTGSGTLEWYSASTGDDLVATGTTYAPNLNATTTYYVSATNTSAPQKVGPANNTLNVGAYYTTDDSRGLFFDVFAECILKTVKVYANTAGNRIIEVLDGIGGTVLKTKTVNIPSGESRVELNFTLQPGTQYYIKVSGTLVDLYRNSSGAAFPYTIAGLVSITETNAAPANPNYYYYFYDWELVTAGCSSSRVAVTGTINQGGATPSISGTTAICSGASTTLTATGGTSYIWSTGATTASITVSPATSQTYTVTASSVGCTGIATAAVAVSSAPTPPTITQNGIELTSSSPTGNQWYLNGNIISGATGQSYKPTQNGNYTVIVTAGGCPPIESGKFNVTYIGISETDNVYSFIVYPNPNDGNFNVMFNINSKADYKLEFKNILGQLIYREILTGFSGTYSKQLNIAAEYGKGIYMISLTSSESETVRKVVIY